jgi:hypothetical protein
LWPSAGGRPYPHQELAHGGRRPCHLGLELVVGEARVAEEARAFLAQLQDVGRNRAVVCLPAVGAACRPGLEGTLAQRALRTELKKRHDQRPRQRDDRARTTALRTRGACGGHDEIGKTLQIILGKVHEPCALVGEHVLREGRRKLGKPRLDCAEPIAPLALNLGAGADEHAPVKRQDTHLLSRQAKGVAPEP